MKSREKENVRNEALLRAEYVLPARGSTSQLQDPEDTKTTDAELEPLLDPLEAATTECTIAQAQLVKRVEALTHRGQVRVSTFARKWLPAAFGLAATFAIGLSLLPLALMGRRRSRGLVAAFAGSGSHRAWPGPVARELLDAVVVGVGYWSQRVVEKRFVREATRRNVHRK